MNGVFVSYRRGDSAGIAGRIHDRLSRAFPGTKVFMDVDGMKAGADYVQQLQQQLEQCRVLIVIIGPGWLDSKNANGSRRLDDESDMVRHEIHTALERDALIVPVLIDDTRMPAEHELPPSIAGLARRHACELRHSRFAADMQQIEQVIRSQLSHFERGGRAILATCVLLAFTLIVGAAYYWMSRSGATRDAELAVSTAKNDVTASTGSAKPTDASNEQIAWRIERDRKARAWQARTTPLSQRIFEEAYRLETAPKADADRVMARQLYEEAALLGHPTAMNNLGVHWQNGLGGPVDLSKAVEWYEKAVEADSPAGMNNLGLMYRNGIGVKQDLAKAFVLLERASEAGHALAMNTLGLLYASGLGTQRSLEKARIWFERSAEAGHSTGMLNLAIYMSKGWGGSAEPRKAAVHWLASARSSENARKELRETTGNFTTETRRAVQQELADSGLYSGPVDGVWTAATRAAVDRWLERHQQKSSR